MNHALIYKKHYDRRIAQYKSRYTVQIVVSIDRRYVVQPTLESSALNKAMHTIITKHDW